MYHIPFSTYCTIADAIVTALVPEKDYCGSIELDGETSDGVDYHFAGSFHGYASDGELSSIVPIWWELHTYDNEGNEILNDASFDEIKRSFLL